MTILTKGMVETLRVLARETGLSRTEISDAVGVMPRTMTSYLRRLADQGYVRYAASLKDARFRYWVLTVDGRERLAEEEDNFNIARKLAGEK